VVLEVTVLLAQLLGNQLFTELAVVVASTTKLAQRFLLLVDLIIFMEILEDTDQNRAEMQILQTEVLAVVEQVVSDLVRTELTVQETVALEL
jgi:hypothetical protein